MEKEGRVENIVSFTLDLCTYGIDIMETHEIAKLTTLRRLPNHPHFMEGMLDIRGEVIPIINFKKLFNFKTFSYKRGKVAIISTIGNSKFGFVVDRINRVVYVEEVIAADSLGVPNELIKYIEGMVLDEYEGVDRIRGKEKILLLDLNKVVTLLKIELDKSYKFTREYMNWKNILTVINEDEERVIYKFLEVQGIKTNKVTDVGIRNYFGFLKLKKRKRIHDIVKELINELSNGEYNAFSFGHGGLFRNGVDFDIMGYLFEELILGTKRGKDVIKVVVVGVDALYDTYSLVILFNGLLEDAGSIAIEYICILEGDSKGGDGYYKAKDLESISKNDYNELFMEVEGRGYKLRKEYQKEYQKVKELRGFEKLMELEDIDICFGRNMFIRRQDDEILMSLKYLEENMREGGILFLGELEDIDNLELGLLETKGVRGRKYYSRVRS